MRVLYVPNERAANRQVGFRRALADLQRAGLVEARVFSLLLRVTDGSPSELEIERLGALVAEFRPHVVLMQHLNHTGLRDRHFRRLRAIHDFELIYHEADPYSRYLHPLPAEARAAGRAADVTFTVGSDVFVSNFLRAGARDVRWASHTFDPGRFGAHPANDARERSADVVVIANRSQPRTPVRGVPGWRQRIRFIDRLQRRLPDNIAIYGRGWDGPGARGMLPFDRQSDAIRDAWVSANWDHYPTERDYYSDRLPISLATGSIHATTEHEGMAAIFGGLPFVRMRRSIDDLIDDIEWVLGHTTVDERIEWAAQARAFAFERFRQDDQLVSFLNYAGPRVHPRAASDAWQPDAPMLEEV